MLLMFTLFCPSATSITTRIKTPSLLVSMLINSFSPIAKSEIVKELRLKQTPFADFLVM